MVDAAHKDTFKHGNRDWKFVPTQVMFRNKHNQEKTPEQRAARVNGLVGKENEKRIRLKELGIEYDFPGYSAIVDGLSKKGPAKVEKKRRESTESVEKPKKSSRNKSVEPEVIEKPKKSSKKITEEKVKKVEKVEKVEEKPRKSSRNKETKEEPKAAKKSKSKK